MTQSPGEAETCRKKYANTVRCPPGARSTNEKWVVGPGDEHYNTVDGFRWARGLCGCP